MAGKPRKAIRPVSKNLSVPEDIAAQVDLLLYSELEGRVPHGAWSRLVETLLKRYLISMQGQGQEQKHG